MMGIILWVASSKQRGPSYGCQTGQVLGLQTPSSKGHLEHWAEKGLSFEIIIQNIAKRNICCFYMFSKC